MAEDRGKLFLDGFAIMAGTSPFEQLAKQPPPTDPRIKHLLGRALTAPESLLPAEVQEMAASIVYHLLAERDRAIGSMKL